MSYKVDFSFMSESVYYSNSKLWDQDNNLRVNGIIFNEKNY